MTGFSIVITDSGELHMETGSKTQAEYDASSPEDRELIRRISRAAHALLREQRPELWPSNSTSD